MNRFWLGGDKDTEKPKGPNLLDLEEMNQKTL